MRLNWNSALLFAAIWIVVGVGGGSIWAHAGMKKQAMSYQVALESLHAMPEAVGLEHDPVQRRAALLKSGSVYDWRALVWIITDKGREPLIWRALVSSEGDTFRCSSTQLHPFTEELASRLSVYERE